MASTITPDVRAHRTDLADRILEVASQLFYAQGVRAVGVDLIVARAGIAKTSLYRHFPTKDALVAAFLEREDKEFWNSWDAAAAVHAADPLAEILAHLDWIAERLQRPQYRGCPQINVAAEFPAPDHPARLVAAAHKREMRRRLETLARRLGAKAPDRLAGQLAVLFNGAFVSAGLLSPDEAQSVLKSAARAVIAESLGRTCGGPPDHLPQT